MTANILTQNDIRHVDYKDTDLLKQFINPHGRIMGRRRSELTANQQRAVETAIKSAKRTAVWSTFNPTNLSAIIPTEQTTDVPTVAATDAAAEQVLPLLAHIYGATLDPDQGASLARDQVQEVVDTCLQFFGGYGYMLEYPVTRAFMDARVQRIFAGTNEIMKVIVAKQLGL